MNGAHSALIGIVSGGVLGWIACALSITTDCMNIGGFVAGTKAYTCEVKK